MKIREKKRLRLLENSGRKRKSLEVKRKKEIEAARKAKELKKQKELEALKKAEELKKQKELEALKKQKN